MHTCLGGMNKKIEHVRAQKQPLSTSLYVGRDSQDFTFKAAAGLAAFQLTTLSYKVSTSAYDHRRIHFSESQEDVECDVPLRLPSPLLLHTTSRWTPARHCSGSQTELRASASCGPALASQRGARRLNHPERTHRTLTIRRDSKTCTDSCELRKDKEQETLIVSLILALNFSGRSHRNANVKCFTFYNVSSNITKWGGSRDLCFWLNALRNIKPTRQLP